MEEVLEATKKCPFCAEVIQADAIKCRFCNEFLHTDKANALLAESWRNQQGLASTDDRVLFYGRPSLWAMAGSVLRGALLWAFAYFLIHYPIEERFDFSEAQLLAFGRYRVALGVGLAVVVTLALLLKLLRLKMTYYEVTPERIEWSRGILDRKVDNLDMFRVVDLKLRRSLLDCLLGIGTVELITTDKTDPQFEFEKIRHARGLYDIIKRASLEADRRSGVVHLE